MVRARRVLHRGITDVYAVDVTCWPNGQVEVRTTINPNRAPYRSVGVPIDANQWDELDAHVRAERARWTPATTGEEERE